MKRPALFREFAELDGLDQIRKFADQYGVLFNKYSPVDHVKERGEYYSVGASFGTSLNLWLRKIAEIKSLVDVWESIASGRIKNLGSLISWKEGAVHYHFVTPSRSSRKLLVQAGEENPFKPGEVLRPARYALQREINDHLSTEDSSREQALTKISYMPRLLRDADAQLHLAIRPRNLLSAMWLQFAQVVAGAYELRRCSMCSRHFLPARNDAVTCSGACRQKKSRKARAAQK